MKSTIEDGTLKKVAPEDIKNGVFELKGVTGISTEAFEDCRGILTAVNLPDVNYLEMEAFSNYPHLEIVNLPEVEDVWVETFKKCPKLKRANLADAKEVGADAFKGCKALEILILHHTVKLSEFALKECDNLKCIILSGPANEADITRIRSELPANLQNIQIELENKLVDSFFLAKHALENNAVLQDIQPEILKYHTDLTFFKTEKDTRDAGKDADIAPTSPKPE